MMQPGTVVVERTLSAKIDRVFDAFTNPASLAQWWGMKDSKVIHCETEIAVGGKWRIGTQTADGKEYWVHGFYREIVEPTRLVFSWLWEPITTSTTEMLVSVILTKHDRQTAIRIVHEATESAQKGHQQGWNDSLDALTKLLTLEV
jgi:uncharacterized protein YndB with AHSA1/START domain